MNIIARDCRPELFSEDERPITDITNAVELVYSQIETIPEGYPQRDLMKDLRAAGLTSYEINIALSILFQLKRVLSIIE
jgi:hypothetical protein